MIRCTLFASLLQEEKRFLPWKTERSDIEGMIIRSSLAAERKFKITHFEVYRNLRERLQIPEVKIEIMKKVDQGSLFKSKGKYLEGKVRSDQAIRSSNQETYLELKGQIRSNKEHSESIGRAV